MDFNVNTEARKVAELLEKSKVMRRLAWGLILMIPTTALIWKLADILTALK
ncbi:TPA: hypothetical protein ACQUH6_001805 [Neisseria polysaccharea]